jgi:hypothetical protein
VRGGWGTEKYVTEVSIAYREIQNHNLQAKSLNILRAGRKETDREESARQRLLDPSLELAGGEGGIEEEEN